MNEISSTVITWHCLFESCWRQPPTPASVPPTYTWVYYIFGYRGISAVHNYTGHDRIYNNTTYHNSLHTHTCGVDKYTRYVNLCTTGGGPRLASSHGGGCLISSVIELGFQFYSYNSHNYSHLAIDHSIPYFAGVSRILWRILVPLRRTIT